MCCYCFTKSKIEVEIDNDYSQNAIYSLNLCNYYPLIWWNFYGYI